MNKKSLKGTQNQLFFMLEEFFFVFLQGTVLGEKIREHYCLPPTHVKRPICTDRFNYVTQIFNTSLSSLSCFLKILVNNFQQILA